MRRRRGAEGRGEERGKSGGEMGREWEVCGTETGSAAITSTRRTVKYLCILRDYGGQ